jgi:hypothetical protein
MENSILFEKHVEFTTDLSGNLPVTIDTKHHEVPEMFRYYEYPVSSWPVIINTGLADTLKELTVKLPKFIKQIPSLYFGNDVKKIADFYFEGNEMLAEFALMCHLKDVEVGCRLDLTLTNGGFKVLEINMGTSIGGWQIQSFESIIRKLHPQLISGKTAAGFESKNTQSIYVKFLIDKILEHVLITDKEINIFLVLQDVGEDITSDVSSFFYDLLKKELETRGLHGQAFVGSITLLKSGNNGDVFFNDKNIHAVLIYHMSTGTIPPFMMRSFLMDKVYFPDHFGMNLLKDKKNLSLLYELACKGAFNAGENELILKYIPLTFIVGENDVVFKGDTYKLPALLQNRKEQFVIKAANGSQGKDVFVGKFLTDEEWTGAIKLALETNNFIAQEFSDSMDFLAPDNSNAWTPHKLIWGAFGFGGNYGGVWVRMSTLKTSSGVINSATGAIEAIVYESR